MCELKEKIMEMDNVLIISHTNPDPDTIGSALGLKYIFSELGKTAYSVCDMPVGERMCGYFDISPEIDAEYISDTDFMPDYIVCVDVASPTMLGKYCKKYYSADEAENKISLVIDHHYTNRLYGKFNYVANTAATGEIIFNLAKELGVPTTDITFARNIYCAIVCDTGAFKYSSTTPETHLIAAELISAGFDFARLNRLIFQNKTMVQITIERFAYSVLKLHCGGKIASVTVTEALKKEAGLENMEIDGISDIPKIVAGVEVGFTMKEVQEATENSENMDDSGYISGFKVSLRSNDYVNVAEIAAMFGGGGHMRAAGCKIYGNAHDVERMLIDEISVAL